MSMEPIRGRITIHADAPLYGTGRVSAALEIGECGTRKCMKAILYDLPDDMVNYLFRGFRLFNRPVPMSFPTAFEGFPCASGKFVVCAIGGEGQPVIIESTGEVVGMARCPEAGSETEEETR